jgi:hypothetical protein
MKRKGIQITTKGYISNYLPQVSIQYAIALISIAYGENDATQFKEVWIPLLCQVVKDGQIFNWSSNLSATILDAILGAEYHTMEIHPKFFISSCLLDVVGVANNFVGM